MVQFKLLFVLIIYSTLLVILCLGERDFYKILGLSRTASDYEIKRNFRKLAKTLHPDKNVNDADASKKFQNLREAFEVLSNPDKKKLYDEGGEERLKQSGNSYSGRGMDPFESFFGSFFGFGSEGHDENKETPRGADVTMDLWVTYEEIYVGQFVEVSRIKSVYKPAKGTRKCNCRQEMITRQLSPGRFQMMQQTVCDECPNMELTTQERILEVEIEPGIKEGTEQKFVGEGEPHIDGDPGDLKVRIRTLAHPIFERRGDDLYTNATISLIDALNGFSITLRHLDGHTVKINRDKVTWPGARIRKIGEGMPNYENNTLKGTLFVTFDVYFPKGDLTPDDKSAIKQILLKYNKDTVDNQIDSSLNDQNQIPSAVFYNGLRRY